LNSITSDDKHMNAIQTQTAKPVYQKSASIIPGRLSLTTPLAPLPYWGRACAALVITHIFSNGHSAGVEG
jgi:hypothetical protein